jgi:four helix bundle protein
MTPDELAERLLNFAVRVGKAVDALPATRLAKHIAGQLIRSGTSPAANYEEARSGESRKDFIHKLRICLKELRETRLWLRMILRSRLLSEKRLNPLLQECDELNRIIAKSITTARTESTK